MITMLLWRCPNCGAEETLRHPSRWHRPNLLACTNCAAELEVIPVPQHDYRIRVAKGSNGLRGTELSLAEWHRRINESVALIPRDYKVPERQDGEAVYLQCTRVPLIALQRNPVVGVWQGSEAPRGPLPGELQGGWATVGPGTLSLTTERLVWEGAGKVISFFWRHVSSAFLFYNTHYGVLYGTTAYRFTMPGQSIVKWLTYTARVAEDIEQRYCHPILLSAY